MENLRLEIVKEVFSNENRLGLNGDIDRILDVAKKIECFVILGKVEQSTQSEKQVND